MALTPDALDALAADLLTRLTGGSVTVEQDAGTRATVPIAELTRDGTVVTVTAEFGEDVANFEWRVRRILHADGWVIDEETADMGRKVPGQVWTSVTELETDVGDPEAGE